MKKLALLFGFLALTSQLPFCPYRALPGDMASSLEYGRKWTGMFLQAYGITNAEPVNSSRNESTDSPIIVASANPVSFPAEPVPVDEPCPYEAAEAALPAVDNWNSRKSMQNSRSM